MQARLRIASTALTLGLVAAIGFAPEASAASSFTSFNAIAKADGARYTFAAPGFVVVDTIIDGGGPTAQSILDGLGNSQSFAALPYPGDTFISGPGLVAGFTNLPAPPAYPFYVTSSYPAQATTAFGGPGLSLQATSGEFTTQGIATTGGEGGGSFIGQTLAQTTIVENSGAGTVTAGAVTTGKMIDIGGVLKIASFSTAAQAVGAAGREPARTSSLVLDGVSIAGQAVGFTDKGFVVAETGAPITSDSPVIEALRQAGIDVRYLAAETDQDGITSPGLVITQTLQVPDGPPLIFTYILGRATAQVTVS